MATTTPMTRATTKDNDNAGTTNCNHAAANGNAQLTEQLIYAGGWFNHADQHRATPLSIASEAGSVGCVKALLRAHANVDGLVGGQQRRGPLSGRVARRSRQR